MTKKDTVQSKERPVLNPEAVAQYQEYQQKRKQRRGDTYTGDRSSHRIHNAKKSPKILEQFLDGLRRGWSPKRSAQALGIARETFFRWRREDETFAQQWADALDEGTDLFEDEAARRAVEGVDKPIFQMGQCVGFQTEYSDSLLQLSLAGRRPERYGKNRTEVTGADGGAVKHEIEVVFVPAKGNK